MKVRNSLAQLKNQPGSIVVRRRGRTVVVNKKNPVERPSGLISGLTDPSRATN